MTLTQHKCGVPSIEESLNNASPKQAIASLKYSFLAMQEYRNHVNENALNCTNVKIITDFFLNKTLSACNYAYINMLMELNETSPGDYFINYINNLDKSQLSAIYQYFTKDKKILMRECSMEFVRLKVRIIEENYLEQLKGEKGFDLDTFYKELPGEYQLGVVL